MNYLQLIKDVSLAISPVLTPVVVYWMLKSAQREDSKHLHKFRSVSDAQMKIFETLWLALNGLESSVVKLWEDGVSEEGVRELVASLKATESALRSAAIVIPADEHQKMTEILSVIQEFKVGKERLLALDDFYDAAAIEIQSQIDANYDYMGKFSALKTGMLGMMRKQIGVS